MTWALAIVGGLALLRLSLRWWWPNVRLGALSRLLDPRGLRGACLRCRTSFVLVAPHDTPYEPGRTAFPLCGKCWRSLGTPEARMPYYLEVARGWVSDDANFGRLPRETRRRLAALASAVRAGL